MFINHMHSISVSYKWTIYKNVMLFKEKKKKSRLHFRVTWDLKLQRNRNGLNCVYTFFSSSENEHKWNANWDFFLFLFDTAHNWHLNTKFLNVKKTKKCWSWYFTRIFSQPQFFFLPLSNRLQHLQKFSPKISEL